MKLGKNMKAGKGAVNLLKTILQFNDKQRMKTQTIPPMVCKLNIPYIDDGEDCHKFDILYANNAKITVIDIHGGSYIMGHRQNNHLFGSKFVAAGMNFISLDYKVNDGNHGVEDLLKDCLKGIAYIFAHQKDLGIKDTKFFLTGDSAGGHLALLTALINDSEKVRDQLNIKFKPVPFLGVLLNCPVYQYHHLGYDSIENVATLTKQGATRLFGPMYVINEQYRREWSPSTHIKELKTPLFVSTCKNDFLRQHAQRLNDDLKLMEFPHFRFIDIYSNDPKIGHVHNVLEPDYAEGIYVNQSMIDFIKELAQ